MKQAEYEQHATGGTQCERILARLQQTPNEEVPMPELAAIGSSVPGGFCMVHSRVADLRKQDHVILSRTEKKDGLMHSFYKLVVNS